MEEIALSKINVIKECKKCGECCSGNIKLTDEEIEKIKSATGSEDFYVTKLWFDCVVIKEIKKIRGRCIFFKDGKCSINDIKPFQCKTYPVIFNTLVLELEFFEKKGEELIFACKSSNCVCSIKEKDFVNLVKQREIQLFYEYSKRFKEREK